MTLSRLLAWEVVAVHVLTGVLFAVALVILFAVTDLDDWRIWLSFIPLIVFAWLAGRTRGGSSGAVRPI